VNSDQWGEEEWKKWAVRRREEIGEIEVGMF